MQSNMTYGVAVDDINSIENTQPLNQPNKHTSGVRVGVGYDLSCLWDADFYWTHLKNHVNGSAYAPPIIANPITESPVARLLLGGDGFGGPATTKWNLSFDTFDLDFGRAIFVCQGFEIRPLVGLKGAVINQSQEIAYINFLDTTTAAISNTTVKQVNDFSGIGPKAGFSAAYDLGWGFDLVGDFAASLLYGTHKIRTTAQLVEPALALESDFINNLNKLIPAFQLSLGVNWNTCLYGCYNLSLGVAYETQYYWNTWRTRDSGVQDLLITNVGYGDLMLHGVTFRLGVTF